MPNILEEVDICVLWKKKKKKSESQLLTAALLIKRMVSQQERCCFNKQGCAELIGIFLWKKVEKIDVKQH